MLSAAGRIPALEPGSGANCGGTITADAVLDLAQPNKTSATSIEAPVTARNKNTQRPTGRDGGTAFP